MQRRHVGLTILALAVAAGGCGGRNANPTSAQPQQLTPDYGEKATEKMKGMFKAPPGLVAPQQKGAARK